MIGAVQFDIEHRKILLVHDVHSAYAIVILISIGLNYAEKINLATKLSTVERTFSDREIQWMKQELEALQDRLTAGTETTYHVEPYSRIEGWLMHRVFLIKNDKLNHLATLRTFNEIDRFFKDLQWNRTDSEMGDLVTYSRLDYTRPIRLASKQNLTDAEIKEIKTALAAGREFTSAKAYQVATRYISDSNQLFAAMHAAGFNVTSDKRLGTWTFIHSRTNAKVILPNVDLGGQASQYTREDQEGFYRAATTGVDYIHRVAAQYLAYKGAAKPTELVELRNITHQGQLQSILNAMGWKTKFLGDRIAYTNPVFKNKLVLRAIQNGETFPRFSAEQVSEVINAIENNLNYQNILK